MTFHLSVRIRNVCRSTAKVCPSSEALTNGLILLNCLFTSTLLSKNPRKWPTLQPNMYLIIILEIKNVTPHMEMQAIVSESCDWSCVVPDSPAPPPNKTTLFSGDFRKRTVRYSIRYYVPFYVQRFWVYSLLAGFKVWAGCLRCLVGYVETCWDFLRILTNPSVYKST